MTTNKAVAHISDQPGSHKPYMDPSLFGCLAGHYNSIGTEQLLDKLPASKSSYINQRQIYVKRAKKCIGKLKTRKGTTYLVTIHVMLKRPNSNAKSSRSSFFVVTLFAVLLMSLKVLKN
ncbi:hypothetical protein DPMN_028130 [Dreissena polymorpha]|uniref:Uncharacterized protein n=1 Tax=Dreissena polymorpha TaxID=45954 RepID=A0A9D4LYE1_DREPO|nr:hypothetical protein DPMN_028130 [Dreissena polymorpha]